MSIQRASGQRPLSTADIAVYVGSLAVGLTLTQLVIGVFDDGRMTVSGGLALAAVAIFVVVFLYARRPAITQRQYGYYFLHVITFLMVNASFWLHGYLLYSSGSGDEITHSWRGVLFLMPLCWSIGLFLHTIGTVLTKGYEHVKV